MTMLSFRVDDAQAANLKTWAERLGLDRSEVLRDALHHHLVHLRAADDVQRWEDRPRTDAESTFDDIGEWGPAEDWSDWTDAAG